MDNIEIDKDFLSVLKESKDNLTIDGKTYTKQNNKWFSEGGYSIEYYNLRFCFLKDGEYHRDNDEPAKISDDGSMIWYKEGKLHRDNDKPAIIWADGTMFWCKNGELHRDNDKPAIIGEDGSREWYQNGVKIVK